MQYLVTITNNETESTPEPKQLEEMIKKELNALGWPELIVKVIHEFKENCSGCLKKMMNDKVIQ